MWAFVLFVYLLPSFCSGACDEGTCDALLSKFSSDVQSWTKIAEGDDVRTYIKDVPGTPLVAFRGISTIAHSLASIMATYSDIPLTSSWVDMLTIMEVIGGSAPERVNECETVSTDAVYQYYDLPFVVSDRDFIFERTWTVNSCEKEIWLEYKSKNELEASFAVDSSARSKKSGVVRAESPGTKWIFKKLSDGSTWIDFETIVDNKGSIPTWLVNMIQRDVSNSICIPSAPFVFKITMYSLFFSAFFLLAV
jgi:hypothetical protein